MGFIINAILLLLFILSTAIAFYNYRPLISEETEQVLFGNIGGFEDLLAISLNHTRRLQEDEKEKEGFSNLRRSLIDKEIRTLDIMDDIERKNDGMLPDTKDYSDVTKMIKLVSNYTLPTRKFAREYYYTYWWLFRWASFHDDEDERNGGPGYIEEEKLDMLGMCAMQFLVHTRYKTKEALSMRSPFKGDKRYMLGYLFNRMRKILYQQRKIIHTAILMEKYRNIRRVRGVLRLYQQVVRLDVDLVDLERYIRRVYQKPARFDHYVE